MRNKSIFNIGLLFIVIILGLANSGLHPVSSSAGYTGAPGDSNCVSCHVGSDPEINGNITIIGLPDTIITNKTYRITVTISNPDSVAKKAGFQLVALTGTNLNAGSMSNNSSGSNIRIVSGGKTYLGHAPADTFPISRTLSYSVDWTSPGTLSINPVIKFYVSGIIANGDNSNSGDKYVAISKQIPILKTATPLSINILDVTSAKCIDSSNGAAKAVPTGGSGGYTYLWSNGVTTSENTMMRPGENSVTVTDNSGASVSANVTIPSPPAIMISFEAPPVCDSSNLGSITALPSGGIGNYTYLWSNGSSSNVLTGVNTGRYSITVSDQNNCPKVNEVDLDVIPPIKISKTISVPSCFGQNNGAISLLVSGGKPGYTYKWSNAKTIEKITNLKAGWYSVKVSDLAGCVKNDSFFIQDPPPIELDITEKTDPICYEGKSGSISIRAVGGNPDYQFMWSDGSVTSGIKSQIRNLSAGIYTVTVTDLLDCTFANEIEIKQPEKLALSPNIKNVDCHGGSDGTINVNVSGTQNPLLYQWTNTDSLKSIENLTAGWYYVSVTDSINKCFTSDSFFVSQPDPLVLIIDTIINNICKDNAKGLISLTVEGGTKKYNYRWSNNDTTALIDNLKAGVYDYIVFDSNGCELKGNITVNEPEGIKIRLDTLKKPICKEVGNGFITIQIQNHEGPYSINWSNGSIETTNQNLFEGKYSVNVTDSLGCTVTDTFLIESNPGFNLPEIDVVHVKCFGDSTGSLSVKSDTLIRYLWSTGDSTNTLVSLPAGKYALSGTDKNGCKSITDSVTIIQPSKIIAELLSSDTLVCPESKNGNITVKAIGGKDSLSYNWSTGDTLSRISSLSPGIYTVTITDKNLCKSINSYQIKPTDSLRIKEKKVVDIFCNSENVGSIEFIAIGGIGTLTYAWSDSSASGSLLTGLAKGVYTVTVTDSKGCAVSDTFIINKVDSLLITSKVTNETISGKKDGKVELNINGGTEPYLIIWSNGRVGATVENMPPGLHNYYIEDKNKCRQTGFVVIGGGLCLLSAKIKSIKHATCFNGTDGKVEIDITGGFTNYNIEIFSSKGLYTLPLDSLQPDKYTMIISDSANCSALITNVIIKSINPSMVLDKIIINGASSTSLKNGRMEAIMKSGSAPFKFLWFKDGLKIGDSSIIENLSEGIYHLIVTDTSGCELRINNIQLPVMTSTEDILHEGIKLYPNPVSDILYLENPAETSVRGYEILNASGQLLAKSMDLPAEKNIMVKDLHSGSILKSGLYYIRIYIDDKIITKKFIVIK